MQTMPTPRRALQVAKSELLRWWRRWRRSIIYLAWICPRFFAVLKKLRQIHTCVAPRENFVMFWYRVWQSERAMHTTTFIKHSLPDHIQINRTEPIDSTASRPSIYVSWHHGIGRIEEVADLVDPNAVIFSAYNLNFKNTVRADHLALIKMEKILAANGRLVIGVDGRFGVRPSTGNLLGLDWQFSETLPFFIKSFKPRVIPFMVYRGNDDTVDFFVGPELFTDISLDQLSNSEITKGIVECLVNDLIQRYPHQINYKYLLLPMRLLFVPR